jgi:hypothetical protein
MDKREIESVIKLNPLARYSYFIKRICDFEEVWVLYHKEKGYAINISKNKEMYLYLFPFQEYALIFRDSDNDYSDFSAKKIDLYEFKDGLIKRFKMKGVCSALVFPVSDGFGLNVLLDKLSSDVTSEIEENY